VDFAIQRGEECLLKVQVKSTSAAHLTTSAAVAALLRLITGAADRYLILATRPATGEFAALCAVLADENSTDQQFEDSLKTLVRRSEPTTGSLEGLSERGWRRLRRCRILIDSRTTADVRREMRESVRRLRRRYCTSAPGWDAAGLLLGHLLWDVLSTAASSGPPLILLSKIKATLSMDSATLAAAVSGRTWAVNVNTPPRLTDIARPELIDQIATMLTVPNPTPQVPACVLHGLSGIGKTSLCAAWANDRSDEYSVIFWIDASTSESIESSFRAVDRWIIASVAPSPVEERLLDRVQAGLSRIGTPWLIVFDNAPAADGVRRWLPRSGLGHAIVTTTNPSSWHGAHMFTMDVPPMTGKQASDLLSRRLSLDVDVDSASATAGIVSLADRFQRWPLALELVSAYLLDTHEGLSGAAGYERLVMRALGDDQSIPPDYPRTLVGAVRFALRRMDELGETSAAARAARMSLRFAAFMHSRQIPFHLLMACVWLNIEWDIQETVHSFSPYTGADPPAGEILRELMKGSLVGIDYPIFGGAEDGVAVRSFDFSVTMNEIVQEVIRADVVREGAGEPVITQAGYFSQRWLQKLLDGERRDLAMVFMGHCRHVARAALEHGISNYATALLWGNSAAALSLVEAWHEAEIYLRAEVGYLTSADRPPPVMAAATYATLILVITRRAIRASDVVDEVCDMIEEVVAWHSQAMRADERGATAEVFKTYMVARELARELPRHMRINELTQRLHDLVPADAALDAQDAKASHVFRLGEMLRESGDLDSLVAELVTRLHDSSYAYHHPTLKRFMVEACIHQGRWDEAAAEIRALHRYVDHERLTYLDVDTLITNVTHYCLSYITGAADDAVRVLANVIALADSYEARGNAFRPGDRARLEVARAYHAMYRTDLSTMLDSLDHVDRHELELAEAGRPVGVRDVHWLMNRWANTLPVPVARVLAKPPANGETSE
jgi:hypothetical protein